MKFKLTLAICAISLSGFAQKPAVPKTDSTAKKPVEYKKIIPENAKGQRGLFDVKQVDQKWFFEVPDSLLGRYLLTVTRYVSTAQGMDSYGGEKINEQTIYFEKGNNNNLFLKGLVYRQEVMDANGPFSKAVMQSQENPIIAAFDIKTINPKTGNYVIEVTDLFKKDVSAISFTTEEKGSKKLSGLLDDRSFIERVNAYPINIEVKTTKTYSTSAGSAPAGAQTGFVTLRLNTSLVLLPKLPMQKRIADERVGYFANKYVLFDEDKQRTSDKFFIQRYRLEPKDQDIEKYKKGILVEPKKQIVYYIDPATPKKWRPYLIKGINDWQKAFEEAGFKNAIVGKEWPEADTTMSLEDARFSVLRYFASEKANAYGPRISDPRSGEIIESHVGWYHNVMKLVHNWYMIQAGPLDPRARKMEFDDELMGDLIRFVSSHEIGHTLGLRHNMGASSQTPVEKLRDKKWVEKNGHTVSIMDYARFNYVAQPEDHISSKGIYPRIGAYDKWAINFGYRYFNRKGDAYAEEKILSKMVTDTLKAHPQLWFGGEGKDEDPRSQSEDLGDDAVAASDYGIKNLKRVVSNLIQWSYEPGDHYDNLSELHKEVVRQYGRYLYHVVKNIGNRKITKRSVDEGGIVYTDMSKLQVKKAVDYINRQLFTPPLWLYPKNITQLIDSKAMEDISDNQTQVLNMLLSPGMLFNLGQKALSSADPYPVNEYLATLLPMIWRLPSGTAEEQAYVRSLQRSYLEKIGMLVNPKDVEEGKAMNNAQRSDVRLEAKRHLNNIREKVQQLLPQSEGINKLHLEDVIVQIDKIIKKASVNP
ncbi:zinc-dependent metalloprotease [Pedobacter sp. MC2016-14]|uniref:zinc-dependent metalloprotease n=1 Tax=Pedobacter sp. MC2016-14 TaxID=2897327 RepID=UPI001E5CE586|nr:zinc-dependent metalloprotease [Pedobacter sp. MC2016-14]MCD0487660.1 zinc-dependent metalloprotease [Pedobacter sp. MC2016-14]